MITGLLERPVSTPLAASARHVPVESLPEKREGLRGKDKMDATAKKLVTHLSVDELLEMTRSPGVFDGALRAISMKCGMALPHPQWLQLLIAEELFFEREAISEAEFHRLRNVEEWPPSELVSRRRLRQ